MVVFMHLDVQHSTFNINFPLTDHQSSTSHLSMYFILGSLVAQLHLLVRESYQCSSQVGPVVHRERECKYSSEGMIYWWLNAKSISSQSRLNPRCPDPYVVITYQVEALCSLIVK